MRLFYGFIFLLVLLPITTSAGESLPPQLAQAIKQAGFGHEGLGLFIQEVTSSEPVVSFQASQFLNPASVIKLVTTAAALGTLGPGYRWSTDVSHSGQITNGRLNGNLYFRGNGDPYLTPERFWRLLNRISIFGISHISGDVVFDSTYFKPDAVDYAAFDDQPYRTYNVGPNAVLVGFQATEFHFSIKQQAGKDAVSITPFPASPKLKIINQVELINAACGAWQKRLTLDSRIVAGEQQVTFSGRYSRTCGKRTLYRRVTETDDHFQHFFLPIWQQLGGSVEGKVRSGSMTKNVRPILEESSISLAQAVGFINKFSNNVMTRQILLSMGAQLSAKPGTTEKGISAVKAWLADHHLDDARLHLDNGAGLSRDARISAALLGRLLVFVFQQAYMPEFVSSLPLSGYDGTMTHRFKGEPLVGQAHIKTGLLDYVQSMAGYVTAASGKRYVVVMLHNQSRAHTKAAEALQNDVLRWVYKLEDVTPTQGSSYETGMSNSLVK